MCTLSLVVKNTGKVALSAKQHKAVVLRLSLGNRKREITLDKVDPTGKLQKPGGKVTFTYPLAGRFPKASWSKFAAKLVFPRKMAEASASNNSASLTLSKQCLALATRLRPRPMPTALPVKVKSVYVKKGTVRVVLVKAKGAKLTKKDASILVAVRVGKTGESWKLRKVDPAGRLAKGREVDFNTRLKAGKAKEALVILRRDSRVVRKEVSLAPSIAAARPAQRPQAVTGVRAPTRSGRRGVRKYYDHGINITSPAEGDIALGGWVTVSYEFTGARPVPGNITVLMFNDSMLQTIYNGPPWEGGTRRLPFPMDRFPAGGGYKIEIYSDLDHRGESHEFVVQEISAGGDWGPHGVLLMRAPVAGAVWPRSTTQRIRWKTEPDDDGRSPSDWSIELHWPGGHETIRRSFRPSYDTATREYYIDYRISSTHRTGSSFTLVVKAGVNPWNTGDLRATSGEFSIPSRSISLRSDFSEPGHTYYYNNDYSIRWRTDGTVPGRMRVSLYHDGRKIRDLSTDRMVSDGYYRWELQYGHLPFSGTGATLGGGYQIGIESVDNPSLAAMSPEFSIRAPYITVTRPRRGDIYYRGDTITIEWMNFHASGNATIFLHGLADIGTVTLLRDIPISRGRATWRVSYIDPPGGGSSGGSTAHPFPEGDGLTISVMVTGSLGDGPPITDRSDESFSIRRERP